MQLSTLPTPGGQEFVPPTIMPTTNMSFTDAQCRADLIQEVQMCGCDVAALEKNYPRVRKGQITEWLFIGYYLVYRTDGTRRPLSARKKDNRIERVLAEFYEAMEKAYRRYRIRIGAGIMQLMSGQEDPKRGVRIPAPGHPATLHNQYRRFFGVDLSEANKINIQQNLQIDVEA